MIDQTIEATTFTRDNQAEIDATRTALLEAVTRFLSGDAKAVLSASAIATITEAVASRNLDGVFATLRPLAPDCIEARLSAAFWDVVDGINFFRDAIGTHWPYMTIAKRQQSLIWAKEHAAQVP